MYGCGTQVAAREAGAVPLVVLVDDREREGVEDGAGQSGVQALRVGLGHEAHLLGEREVEVGHLPVAAPPRPVADRGARRAALERVATVEAPEARVARLLRPSDPLRAGHPCRLIGVPAGVLEVSPPSGARAGSGAPPRPCADSPGTSGRRRPPARIRCRQMGALVVDDAVVALLERPLSAHRDDRVRGDAGRDRHLRERLDEVASRASCCRRWSTAARPR